MELILVSTDTGFRDLLQFHLKRIGIEVVQFGDPVALTQRLDELVPEMVLFDAGEFPRHWKPLLSLIRERRTKEEAVFVLIQGPDFGVDEAAKATHLGANGILSPESTQKHEIYRLEEMFKRYKSLADQRRFQRYILHAGDHVGMVFTHPEARVMVLGEVKELSIKGLSFTPLFPGRISDLPSDTYLRACSLRVGDQIVTIDCRVCRSAGDLGLQIESFGEGGHHALQTYLRTRSRLPA